MIRLFAKLRHMVSERRLIARNSAFDGFRRRPGGLDDSLQIPEQREPLESPEITKLRETVDYVMDRTESEKSIVAYISDSLLQLSVQPMWRGGRFDLEKAFRVIKYSLESRFRPEKTYRIMSRIMGNKTDPEYLRLLFGQKKKIEDYIDRETKYLEARGERVAGVLHYGSGRRTVWRDPKMSSPGNPQYSQNINKPRRHADFMAIVLDMFKDNPRPDAGKGVSSWHEEISKQIAWETKDAGRVNRADMIREAKMAYRKRLARIQMGLEPIPYEQTLPSSRYRDLTLKPVSPNDPRIKNMSMDFEEGERERAVERLERDEGFASPEQKMKYLDLEKRYGKPNLRFLTEDDIMIIVWQGEDDGDGVMEVNMNGGVIDGYRHYSEGQLLYVYNRRKKGSERILQTIQRAPAKKAETKEYDRSYEEYEYGKKLTEAITKKDARSAWGHEMEYTRPNDDVVIAGYGSPYPYRLSFPYYNSDSGRGHRAATVHVDYKNPDGKSLVPVSLYFTDRWRRPIGHKELSSSESYTPETLATVINDELEEFVKTGKRSDEIYEQGDDSDLFILSPVLVNGKASHLHISENIKIMVKDPFKRFPEVYRIPKDMDQIDPNLGIMINAKGYKCGPYMEAFYSISCSSPVVMRVYTGDPLPASEISREDKSPEEYMRDRENQAIGRTIYLETREPEKLRFQLRQVLANADQRIEDSGETFTWAEYFPKEERGDRSRYGLAYDYLTTRVYLTNEPVYIRRHEYRGGRYYLKQGDNYFVAGPGEYSDDTDGTIFRVSRRNLSDDVIRGAPGEEGFESKEKEFESKKERAKEIWGSVERALNKELAKQGRSLWEFAIDGKEDNLSINKVFGTVQGQDVLVDFRLRNLDNGKFVVSVISMHYADGTAKPVNETELEDVSAGELASTINDLLDHHNSQLASGEIPEIKEVNVSEIERYGYTQGNRIVLDQYNSGWVDVDEEIEIGDGDHTVVGVDVANPDKGMVDWLAKEGILLEIRSRFTGWDRTSQAVRVSFTHPKRYQVFVGNKRVHIYQDGPSRAKTLQSRFESAESKVSKAGEGYWVEFGGKGLMCKYAEDYYGKFGDQYYKKDPLDYTWVRIKEAEVPDNVRGAEVVEVTPFGVLGQEEVVTAYGYNNAEKLDAWSSAEVASDQGRLGIVLPPSSDGTLSMITFPSPNEDILKHHRITVLEVDKLQSDGSKKRYYRVIFRGKKSWYRVKSGDSRSEIYAPEEVERNSTDDHMKHLQDRVVWQLLGMTKIDSSRVEMSSEYPGGTIRLTLRNGDMSSLRLSVEVNEDGEYAIKKVEMNRQSDGKRAVRTDFSGAFRSADHIAAFIELAIKEGFHDPEEDEDGDVKTKEQKRADEALREIDEEVNGPIDI